MHEAVHAPPIGIEPSVQSGGSGGIITRNILAKVIAGGERSSCSGQDDHPYCRIGIGLVERVMEFPFEPMR